MKSRTPRPISKEKFYRYLKKKKEPTVRELCSEFGVQSTKMNSFLNLLEYGGKIRLDGPKWKRTVRLIQQ